MQVDQALADDRKLTISRNYFAATAEVGKVAGDAGRVTATDNCRDAGSRLGDLAATILSGFAIPKPTADTPTAADGLRCNDTIAPEVLEKLASWVVEKSKAR